MIISLWFWLAFPWGLVMLGFFMLGLCMSFLEKSLFRASAHFVLFSIKFHEFFIYVLISCSGVSDSSRPHELQHTRPPCPSPTPGVYPNSRPLSRWCHPTISSSVVPFSSVFNLSQHQGLFKWVNSSHEVAKVLEFLSALASFLPKKSQGWSPF